MLECDVSFPLGHLLFKETSDIVADLVQLHASFDPGVRHTIESFSVVLKNCLVDQQLIFCSHLTFHAALLFHFDEFTGLQMFIYGVC